MRAGFYYVISAVLVLATVPMYRYIIERARAVDAHPQPLTVQPVRVVPPVSADTAGLVPLMRGEECHGGYVFVVSSNTYVQAVDANGVAARCSGRFLARPQR